MGIASETYSQDGFQIHSDSDWGKALTDDD